MPQRQKITLEDWESHRTVLERLYLDEGENLRKIMAEMGEKYRFWPSKSQYETAFKRWNFRKYMTESELTFLDRCIKKRKVDNKETEVYLTGRLIPAKRVKKELDRHFTPCYQQPYTAAPSPQTPPDIAYRTPRDMAIEPPPDIALLDIVARTPQDMTVEPLLDIAPLDIVFQTPHYMAVQTPKNPANSEIRLDTLPWFQFQWFLESNAHLVAQIFHRGNHRVCAPLSSLLGMIISKVWALGSSVQQDISLAQPGSVESFMKAVLLERNPGEFQLSTQKLLGPFSCDALTVFLKYIAYLSSNNMLSNDEIDQFLEWIIKTNNRSTLEAFFSVKIPTINAFARCVFESALRIKDAAVLRILLKAGVDPGLPTKMQGRTPLQEAVLGCRTELARILLDERVDVNICTLIRIVPYGKKTWETALSVAGTTGSVEMIRMLLDAGADTETLVYSSMEDGTALQQAVKIGNVELVRLLLSAGADVNARDIASLSCTEGTVLQRVASGKNHEISIELARLLLDAGANVNAPSRAGMSALWLATACGYVEIIRILLDAGAAVNNDNYRGSTPLMNAVNCLDVKIVRMLLDAGADVNARVFNFHRTSGNALAEAASGNSVEIVRMLLHAGADVNVPADSSSFNPLNRAAWGGRTEIVQILLAAGADVNAVDNGRWYYGRDNYGTALEMAVRGGRTEIVQILLAAGADVNAVHNGEWHHGRDNYGAALEMAARGGRTEIVCILLAAGADFNVVHSGEWHHGRDNYGTALKMAAQSGSVATVRMLLAPHVYARTASSSNSLLMRLVNFRSVEIVRRLLDAGMDSNAPADSLGYNPLKMAARGGNAEIVQMLLNAGAEVNATAASETHDTSDPSDCDSDCDSSYGFTALQAAVKSGSVEIVQMLMDAGADVRACENPPLPWVARAMWQDMALVLGLVDDSAGMRGMNLHDKTTCKLAIQRSHNILVQVLLNAGADVNAMDEHDRTALEIAIANGHDILAQTLLDAGADANALSPSNERSALGAAVHRDDINLVQKLLDAGAEADLVYFHHYDLSNKVFPDIISVAANNGNVAIVQLLIHAGADVNASAVLYVDKNEGEGEDGDEDEDEDEDKVDTLDGPWLAIRTALVCATLSGDVELIEVLLNGGADVNARLQTSLGWTALQAAAFCGNTEVAQILLDACADINAPACRKGGRTALQAAVIKGHTALARSLLIAGAGANAPAAEKGGVTALQAAAIKGYLGIALSLIEAGADPNALPAKRNGRTALEGAAEHGRLDMVEFLLSAGADIVDIPRARMLAENNGHFAIVEFLKRFYNMGIMSPFVD